MARPAPQRLVLAGSIALGVIALDQLTKTLAEDHLRAGTPGVHLVGPVWLTLVYNHGAAFGIGGGAAPVVEAVVAVLVAVLLVGAARHSARSASRTEAVAVGLLVGGALSNLVDRLVRGHGGGVTDFINALQIGRVELWPVFNLADASIVIGAALLALRLTLRSGTGSRRGPATGEPGARSPAGERREPGSGRSEGGGPRAPEGAREPAPRSGGSGA
jgi:signal peptidase II